MFKKMQYYDEETDEIDEYHDKNNPIVFMDI